MISFEDRVEWSDEDIGVILWARRQDERIRCIVRGEAIESRFGRCKDSEERLRTFAEHRSVIEDRVRDKIESGHLERAPHPAATWQAVVLPADMK